MFSWLEFVHQLKVNFGPLDLVRDAEEDLDHLKMKENQKIAKYNVEFNCLAAQCKWGKALLHQAYYKGLPTCIKDGIVHTSKGTTLEQL
jgi:hypothetical protein